MTRGNGNHGGGYNSLTLKFVYLTPEDSNDELTRPATPAVTAVTVV